MISEDFLFLLNSLFFSGLETCSLWNTQLSLLPSGQERGETIVFAGYGKTCLEVELLSDIFFVQVSEIPLEVTSGLLSKSKTYWAPPHLLIVMTFMIVLFYLLLLLCSPPSNSSESDYVGHVFAMVSALLALAGSVFFLKKRSSEHTCSWKLFI